MGDSGDTVFRPCSLHMSIARKACLLNNVCRILESAIMESCAFDYDNNRAFNHSPRVQLLVTHPTSKTWFFCYLLLGKPRNPCKWFFYTLGHWPRSRLLYVTLRLQAFSPQSTIISHTTVLSHSPYGQHLVPLLTPKAYIHNSFRLHESAIMEGRVFAYIQSRYAHNHSPRGQHLSRIWLPQHDSTFTTIHFRSSLVVPAFD